jgi:hypothetical protein
MLRTILLLPNEHLDRRNEARSILASAQALQ